MRAGMIARILIPSNSTAFQCARSAVINKSYSGYSQDMTSQLMKNSLLYDKLQFDDSKIWRFACRLVAIISTL